MASANGTTIPPTSLIFDDHGVPWKVVAGKVYRNGIVTISSSVTLLLYWNNKVYQKNVWNDWWWWDNTLNTGGWKATPNPTPAPTPRPTPAPSLPVGETKVDFYMDDKLVNSTKLVPDGS